MADPPFKLLRSPSLLWGGCFSEAECLLLLDGLWEFRRVRLEQTGDASCPPFFLVIRSVKSTPTPSGGSASSLSLEVAPLEAYDRLSDDVRHSSVVFGLIDPGTERFNPGWPLRNFLMLLAARWGLTHARILCFRGRLLRSDGAGAGALSNAQAAEAMGDSYMLEANLSGIKPGPTGPPDVVGWESNRQGKPAPQQVDLSSLMDPVRLAESSVDLNLKLMRWRLLPALDVPMLAQTRCLLLGAGTLGCGVARCLLGWGVRTITLVDNGKVSLSNPVRQSLFEFADCANGGKLKAPAAAEALRRIFPGVTAEGHVLSIPMPGHPLQAPADVDAARRDAAQLEALVQSHDVVFLLTDTRESRWLPTVLAAAHDKILLNAALGFDTFMVMRHGAGVEPDGHPCPERLGCYFCNDVVAPDDSTRDRTLDQQCTVTRPGLAQVAAALAVELMVALMHHPKRHRAPADTSEGSSMENLGRLDDPDRPLGILPQQIRGFLAYFTNILPVTRAFDRCTGCSKAVLDQYRADGFGLVLNAADNPGGGSYLEELTGLAALRKQAEAMDLAWDDPDDDDDDDDGDDDVMFGGSGVSAGGKGVPKEGHKGMEAMAMSLSEIRIDGSPQETGAAAPPPPTFENGGREEEGGRGASPSPPRPVV